MKQPQVGKSLDRALSYRMKNAKVLAWHRLAVQDKSLDFLHLIAICLHPLVLLLKIKALVSDTVSDSSTVTASMSNMPTISIDLNLDEMHDIIKSPETPTPTTGLPTQKAEKRLHQLPSKLASP